MSNLHEHKTHRASGMNRLLGSLVCYSCQRHTRLDYDKTLWLNWPQKTPSPFRMEWDATVLRDSHPVHVIKTGELIVGCDCCSKQFLESIIKDLESISHADLIPFGQGVALEYFGKRIECSQCGSEEFCNPENAEQSAAPYVARPPNKPSEATRDRAPQGRRCVKKKGLSKTRRYGSIQTKQLESRNMTTMTLQIDDVKADALRRKARRVGLEPEQLLAASVDDLIGQPDSDFDEAAHRVLSKNRELYKRLA